MAKSKAQKSLGYRKRQTLEPNTLTEDQFDEHWRGITVTFVKEGLGIALRADAREITRSHPEVFTVDHACEVDTQSGNGHGVGTVLIDYESSDAVKLKQLRDQMV